MVDEPKEVVENANQPTATNVRNPEKVTPDSGRGTVAVSDSDDGEAVEPQFTHKQRDDFEEVATSTPGSVRLVCPPREKPIFTDDDFDSPNMRRREREPTKFNGKSDWTDYLSHFTAVTKWNKWSYSEMGLQLAISLTDDAREVLGGLTSAQKHDYNSLVDALNRRFSPEGRESMFSLQLMNRVCGDKEDITTYGHAIRRLATKAYPNQVLDEKVLVDMFIKGLPSAEMKRHVYLAKTQLLSEAINCAIAYEAFDKPANSEEKVKKPKVTVAPVAAKGKEIGTKVEDIDHVKSQFTEALTRMTDALGELKQQVADNQRKPKKDLSKVECYNCHENGHYSKFCPKKDPLRAGNSNRTNNSGQSN